MRVRVSYVIEANEYLRRAINHHYGRPGLATRAEVQDWYESFGRAGDDDLFWDFDQAEKRREAEEIESLYYVQEATDGDWHIYSRADYYLTSRNTREEAEAEAKRMNAERLEQMEADRLEDAPALREP